MAKASPQAQPPCPSCGYLADPGSGPLNFCPACGQDRRGRATGRPRTERNALLGHVIGDRYELLALLGEGGMGAVYKAQHVRMGKALAVKVLRGDFAADPGAVARFRAEAQIVSRLSHPHTIAVFDFGEIEEVGGFYLAMEYVPGKDLAQVLRAEGRFSEARVASIGQQVLGSLSEAHGAGVVHRDMKPGNVMVMQTRPGEDFAKVLDFGIAKLREEGASTSTTSAGAIVGTPSYLAPEQARGDGVDARADLYAVGCVLYELVAGRPPFVAPNPMAVVSAHLHDPPPPLAEVAPGTSRRFAEIVHRALAKKPGGRFASADEMRDALLALGEPTRSRPVARPAHAGVTGDLGIARREDFAELERHVRALRRTRLAAPVSAVLLLAAAAGTIWRWPEVYALLAAKVPALAAAVPPALRPGEPYDGAEREPNDVAARANPLPLPPGEDGRPAAGTAVMSGHVGARLDDATGDADVFRIEVPAGGQRVLVADWRGDRDGEGIRGLDVTVSLNRERGEGDARTSAPLVAAVDRGGAGAAERLVAAVLPGTYYLAVREKHDPAGGPVENPIDAYRLEVRLDGARPGEALEPDDAPEAMGAREERYPEWRALAERNPLGEGIAVAGETSPDDPDLFAVGAGEPSAAPAAVVAIPAPGLALTARRWVPDATDLAPPAPAERVRFEPAGEAGPGEVLVVPLPEVPRADAPALVQLRAAEGEGRYTVLALGERSAGGAAVLGLVRSLAEAGRLPAALDLAASFARSAPRSPSVNEVLGLAGQLASARAPAVPDLPAFEAASRRLGAAIYELEGEVVRYRAAFEARVEGTDRVAEVAAVEVVRRAAPCSPEAIALRAARFVERFPEGSEVGRVRRWRARALEEALWTGAGADAALRAEARAAWERIAQGEAAAEAKAALARLAAKAPPAERPAPVCPDPERAP
jgi:eukaryotic-like serine/threonine-protein kinase